MSVHGASCTICKRREAFFSRPYSGEKLCKKCFARSIEDKVRATIAKYGMLRFSDRVAVAVSGGKDSLSLLHVLARIERNHPRTSLIAVTVDEGIKGYRDEGYTLDEIVKRQKQEGRNSVTSCGYCGVLRRKALNLAARTVKADKLATGHTLDDETQTILLNIFHGDVFRLAREKPITDEVHMKLVRRIKPLCEIPERETALYAYIKKVRFQSSPCPYASEALRNDVRMMLNRMEERHAGTKFTVFRAIERIRPAIEEAAKEEGLMECEECGEPTSEKVCRTCQMLKQIRETSRYSSKEEGLNKKGEG
jgi:uncharacterized protein (TIGR00269 family)